MTVSTGLRDDKTVYVRESYRPARAIRCLWVALTALKGLGGVIADRPTDRLSRSIWNGRCAVGCSFSLQKSTPFEQLYHRTAAAAAAAARITHIDNAAAAVVVALSPHLDSFATVSHLLCAVLLSLWLHNIVITGSFVIHKYGKKRKKTVKISRWNRLILSMAQAENHSFNDRLNIFILEFEIKTLLTFFNYLNILTQNVRNDYAENTKSRPN